MFSNLTCLGSNLPASTVFLFYWIPLGRKASGRLRKPSALAYLKDEGMGGWATVHVQEGEKGIFGRSAITDVLREQLPCAGCFNSFVSTLSPLTLSILEHQSPSILKPQPG